MKVSEIVRKTEEYDELQMRINDIETALKNITTSRLTKTEEKKTVDYVGTTLSIQAGSEVWYLDGAQVERVSVNLDKKTSVLIRDDFEALLRKHLKELKKKQDNLQIGGN